MPTLMQPEYKSENRSRTEPTGRQGTSGVKLTGVQIPLLLIAVCGLLLFGVGLAGYVALPPKLYVAGSIVLLLVFLRLAGSKARA